MVCVYVLAQNRRVLVTANIVFLVIIILTTFFPNFNIFFSQSAKRSELLFESEARSAESLQSRSAESRSDDASNARRCAQADANLGQVFFLYIYFFLCFMLYLFIFMCAWIG